MNPKTWPLGARIGLAIVVALGIVFGLTSSGDDPAPNRRLTVTEAACEMIADGDSPDTAYLVLVDLGRDHPYALGDPELVARAAVDRAVAGGC